MRHALKLFGLLLFGLLLSLTMPADNAARGENLPDGIITVGQRDIAAAWLTGPSRIYHHGVLGDDIEATGLRLKMRDGRELNFRLPGDSVFEDRKARLADLDGDGGDEILVVRSYLRRGAALAVFRPAGNRIVQVAETEPIGLAHRWLNPAGVADFDLDGQLEVAVVLTPHIGGTLKIYQLRGDKLVEEWSSQGYSNHVMGSRNLDLALILNNGPKSVLVLPRDDRLGLREVAFVNGGYRVLEFDVYPDSQIVELGFGKEEPSGNYSIKITTESGASDTLYGSLD